MEPDARFNGWAQKLNDLADENILTSVSDGARLKRKFV